MPICQVTACAGYDRMEPIIIGVIVFFVAVVFSMLGLGGGLVYVPLFYWLGIDMLIAIPTAILLNAVTSSSAAITYVRKKMVDLHTAAPFIISSTIGAPVGAYFTQFTPVETLLWTFSVILVFTGARIIFSKSVKEGSETPNLDSKKITVIGAGLGFLIGVAAGMLGIGGGVFIVPILITLGFGMKRAAATSGFIIVFSSVSGFLGHLGSSYMDVELMIYTAIAAFIGGQVGSHLMYNKIRSKTIKQMFGVVLWVMAIKIVIGLM
ncbi:MAG TPA: sulfite exporter TauE/SafE family protein [Methanosarcinaceae archaeon]|nr:sulfite exporter TauE/SafE family protein [Methanosarcinaceae archaeon]